MNGQKTKLIFPGLAGFYKSLGPFAYTLVRAWSSVSCLSCMFRASSTPARPRSPANLMSKNGLEPAILFAYAAIFLESVGGACIIIGLFTRFFAAALAIEMLIALFAGHGGERLRSWSGGGTEYTVLLIGVVMFAIAIRGGGPYSVDPKIGKEL